MYKVKVWDKDKDTFEVRVVELTDEEVDSLLAAGALPLDPEVQAAADRARAKRPN